MAFLRMISEAFGGADPTKQVSDIIFRLTKILYSVEFAGKWSSTKANSSINFFVPSTQVVHNVTDPEQLGCTFDYLAAGVIFYRYVCLHNNLSNLIGTFVDSRAITTVNKNMHWPLTK